MAVLGLGFGCLIGGGCIRVRVLLHVVHVACRVLGIMFLMTKYSHQFPKRMTVFSHSCPTCMTSRSHISLVKFRSFSIVYYIDDF
jgi:hypothetical protein